MAKITTITNPLTGQPAQVDQLDHTAQEIDDAIARALPGGAIDITLQNKAPAGYGLGDIAKTLKSTDDANDIWQSGWYQYIIGNIPQNGITLSYRHLMRVDGYTSGVFVQTVYGLTDNENDYQICSVARRFRYATKITPWEYENPPMKLGIEYRTTERYLGKPVYCKLFDLGSFSAGSSFASGTQTEGLDKVIRFEGLLDNTIPLPYLYDSLDNTKTAFLRVSPIAGDPRIIVTVGSAQAGKNVKSTIYYTKSTD